MKPSSKSAAPSRRRGVVYAGLTLALAAGGAEARACGPMFPNRYLDAGTEQLLAAPEAHFAAELTRLLPPGTPRVEERRYNEWQAKPRPAAAERSTAADVSELATALRAAGRAEGEVERLVEAYRQARAGGGEAPADVPAEFALYLKGAQAWKRREAKAARAAWRAVLDLPEAERRHRALWAAYMLGRSHLVLTREDPQGRDVDDEVSTPLGEAEVARGWFLQAEELAARGAADPLGLAGEAKGWRARLAAESREFLLATSLYLERLAAGDDTAAQSLRRLGRRIVWETYGEELEACVGDAKTRGLAVAFLLAHGAPAYDRGRNPGWPEPARKWAMAIRRADAREVPGADRLAWLAYEGGLFGLAEEWLRIAPADSAEADWLRSKLALRAGKAAEGAKWLESALREGGLAGGHRNLAWAELARTRLALDRPAEALRAFLGGGHWEDCAYVAERVLTADELAALVDAGAAPRGEDTEALGKALRSLLARRLAREGRDEAAARYFPAEVAGPFARYRSDVRAGFDSGRTAAERAEALWRAARALRENGMNWIGTELEPDWAIWGGAFEAGPAAEARSAAPKWEGGLFAPTAEEQARIARGEESAPRKRFHYRYEAAQLGWWAASLMPDQDEATARVLWTAGSWLKARDPKAAEPFYRALVLRCGKTVLGREAARRRWFPPEIGV